MSTWLWVACPLIVGWFALTGAPLRTGPTAADDAVVEPYGLVAVTVMRSLTARSAAPGV